MYSRAQPRKHQKENLESSLNKKDWYIQNYYIDGIKVSFLQVGVDTSSKTKNKQRSRRYQNYKKLINYKDLNLTPP